MQKWFELILAALGGAVVPVITGVWWISHVDTKVEEMRSSLPDQVELKALRSVEAKLDNHETIKQLSGDINRARILTEKAGDLSSATSEEAQRLKSLRKELTVKVNEQVNKADLALVETSQTLEQAIQNPTFQNAVVDKVKIPSGAVFAFDLENGCPLGWSDFSLARGRMIVGATLNDGVSEGLTPRKWQSTGGEEKVTLKPAELPPHEHTHNDFRWQSTTRKPPTASLAGGGWGYSPENSPGRTSSVGGGKPHNNMPPYIALYYCKKD